MYVGHVQIHMASVRNEIDACFHDQTLMLGSCNTFRSPWLVTGHANQQWLWRRDASDSESVTMIVLGNPPARQLIQRWDATSATGRIAALVTRVSEDQPRSSMSRVWGMQAAVGKNSRTCIPHA